VGGIAGSGGARRIFLGLWVCTLLVLIGTWMAAREVAAGTPQRPAGILFHQDETPGRFASWAQDLPPAFDAFDSQTADDFPIDPGVAWQVSAVEVAGGGPGVPDSFNVVFYADSGGAPGAPIYTATQLAYTAAPQSYLTISLPAPAVLTGPRVWLAVQANLPAATSSAGWTWANITLTGEGYAAARFRNPGDGFQRHCLDWAPRTGCTPEDDSREPNQGFRILGTAEVLPTATPTATWLPGTTPTVPATATAPPLPTVTRTPTPWPTTPPGASIPAYSGGQLTWAPGSGAGTVVFRVRVATCYWCDAPHPQVGDSRPGDPLAWGDGGTSDSTYQVTYIDPPSDLVLLEKTASHTYAGAGPYTARLVGCCRMAAPALVNNPDQCYSLAARVVLSGDPVPPVVQAPPIVDCPADAPCAFRLPGLDATGQVVRFRFPQAGELCDPGFAQPGPPAAPDGAALDADGFYRWDTTGARRNATGSTFYSTMVVAESLDSAGAVRGSATLDFLIRIAPPGNGLPAFGPPSPLDGATLVIPVGQRLSLPVAAADPDGRDSVTLAVLGLPAGAGFAVPPAARQVASTLAWNPANTDAGAHVLTFLAVDNHGGVGTLSVRILVQPDTACTVGFSDAGPGTTFYPYIHCLACLGLVNGYAGGTFLPGNPVTRGQLAKIVANAAGLQAPPGAPLFADVSPEHPFYAYIQRLANRGYVGGYTCGAPDEPCPGRYFRPGAAATRGQIAKIVANAAGLTDGVAPTQQTFVDVPPGHPFRMPIERLASRGIISGYACGAPEEPCPGLYFRPAATTTRGQMAKLAANSFFPDCRIPARRE
jgi:hypothetical protein